MTLIAIHVPQTHDACAAVAVEDQPEGLDLVAATQGAWNRKGKGTKRPQQPHQKALGRHIDLSKRRQEQGHSLRTSVCFYHAKLREQAKYCEEGCVWPEN
jgi:hypothetical protein